MYDGTLKIWNAKGFPKELEKMLSSISSNIKLGPPVLRGLNLSGLHRHLLILEDPFHAKNEHRNTIVITHADSIRAENHLFNAYPRTLFIPNANNNEFLLPSLVTDDAIINNIKTLDNIAIALDLNNQQLRDKIWHQLMVYHFQKRIPECIKIGSRGYHLCQSYNKKETVQLEWINNEYYKNNLITTNDIVQSFMHDKKFSNQELKMFNYQLDELLSNKHHAITWNGKETWDESDYTWNNSII